MSDQDDQYYHKEMMTMYQLRAIYNDYSTCCYDFILGIECLNQRAISRAVKHFSQACSLTPKHHYNFNKYQSYLGLASVLSGNESGLLLCQRAIQDADAEGDLYLNLARAQRFSGNRLATIKALNAGLAVEADHSGLNEMRIVLGVRRSRPIIFLARQHYLNDLLGKMLRKNSLSQ
ncbi:MAG: hypothetical protein ACN4GM_04125 [Gammaproteobacteria bacterium]